MDLLKAHCVLKTDPPCVGGSDEVRISDEENPILKDGLLFHTLQFAGQER